MFIVLFENEISVDIGSGTDTSSVNTVKKMVFNFYEKSNFCKMFPFRSFYSLFQKFWQSAHFGQFLLKEKKYNQK